MQEQETQLVEVEGINPFRPITLFLLYYCEDIIDSIVEATNQFIQPMGISAFARGKRWYPMYTKEIYIYLAIQIYIMIYIENKLDYYWGTSISQPNHPISKYLSKDRFLELYIRFRLGSNFKNVYI